MKVLKVSAASLVLVIAIVIIVAPIGPLPGFFIRGTPTEVPAKWPDTSSEHEIMLQVGSMHETAEASELASSVSVSSSVLNFKNHGDQ